MNELLPLTLAGVGTLTLLLGALALALLLFVLRRQLAIRWHRLFGEPADAQRARGDVGEALALDAARAMAQASPEQDLRVFPGRLFRPTEIDLLILTRSALWVVECKAWSGRLVAGADGWLSWSSPRRGAPRQQRRRNPVRQARSQAKTVSRYLVAEGLKAVPVRDVVVFSHPDVDLDGVRDEGFVLYLDELEAFFRIGPGGEGSPMDPAVREDLARLLETMPAWDFLALEGGGRRGRITTDYLSVTTSSGPHLVPLAEVHQATFRLFGWPRQRLAVQMLKLGSHEALEGVATNPVDRLWIKEPDGKTRPYPLCVLQGFVRGGQGSPARRPAAALDPYKG
jgi:hypothetical protein